MLSQKKSQKTQKFELTFKPSFHVESKKTREMSMFKPCCNVDGDVRGMCFTCIGELSKMDTDTLLRVRACPQTPYAMAYWFYNNHNDEFSKQNWNWLFSNKYIKLITDDKMLPLIYTQLLKLRDDGDSLSGPCDKCYNEALVAATAPGGVGLDNMEVMCDCD